MKVGIWCAYGKTLEPSEGIGVFTHNLARALLGDQRVERIVIAIQAGEDDRVAATVAHGAGRIATVAIGRLPWWCRWRRKQLRWRHRRLCDALAVTHEPNVARRRDEVERAIRGLYARQPISDRRLFESCDVWLLPHVAVERGFPAATVVVVHDMVPLHISGVVKQRDLESFRRRCMCLVDEATLVATMSQVIRDVDIVGLLRCDPDKVRVIPPAAPADFSIAEERSVVAIRRPFLDRPYVIYPAAFRPYKNHAALVEALAALHRHGHREMQLVFTGIRRLPASLARRIDELGVAEHVHVLGKVTREELARLYCEAVATVVPSLYEQGSFPILEALHWGCPVAASDLPALREALEPLGDSMLFFDPRNAAAMADTIAAIAADRDAVRLRQAQGFADLQTRTWADVAREWATVFAEAVSRRRGP